MIDTLASLMDKLFPKKYTCAKYLKNLIITLYFRLLQTLFPETKFLSVLTVL